MNKNIVLISGCYYGQVCGGSEYQQFLIGTYLKKLNYKIFYMYVDNGNPIKYKNHFKLIKIKKRILLRRLFGRYFFIDILKIHGWLKKIKPEVILIRSGSAYVGIAALYCKNHNCKMIWHIPSKKDVEPFEFNYKRSIIFDYIDKKFLEFGIKNANHIICQAKYQDDLLYQNYERRSALIISNFHPRPKEKIRKKMPIKVVWIANFKKSKQPGIFVKLAKEFNDIKNVKFMMIGRYAAVGWQKDFFSEIRKFGNFEYLGELPMEKVNNILSDSHILVNTSKYEGFPNTFIQAWMRKVPTVSLNVDPDEIIKKNKIGFHSGNFQQMVKDIRLLIDNNELRQKIGKRAQNYAFKNFSLKNIERIVELIKS